MKTVSIGFVLMMSAALLGAQTAVVREITGTVEIKAPGAAEWQPAKKGEVLDQAFLISTGFKSTATIKIGNSDIIVRPLTRLSLEEIAAARDGEQVTLELRTGRIRANVKPPEGGGKTSFSVRSPSATASVRGTVFDFDGIHLKVEEGRVHLSGENVTGAYVGQGHTTAMEPETGSTVQVIEALKSDLSPALPVGVDIVPTVPAAPSGGDLRVSVEWVEE
jgi:hypothetical protein